MDSANVSQTIPIISGKTFQQHAYINLPIWLHTKNISMVDQILNTHNHLLVVLHKNSSTDQLRTTPRNVSGQSTTDLIHTSCKRESRTHL